MQIEDTIEKTLQKSFKIRPRTRQMYVMPSFNDFLGGHPLNETHNQKTQDTETLIGPVLRSRAVDLENSELYLLDGTYLGAMRQFRQL